MRKSCAKPVDELRMDRGNEYILYPASTPHLLHYPHSSTFFPQFPQPAPTTLSTLNQSQSNLLYSYFPTISTGLITNTIN